MHRLPPPVRDIRTRRQILTLLGGSIALISLATCSRGTAATTQSTVAASVATATTARSSAVTATTTPAGAKSTASAKATAAQPPKAAVATPAAGAVTLRWVFGDMDQGRAKLLDKVAAQFEQSHPGVKVQAELSSALETSIPTWAASGTLYDVFFNLTNEIAPRAVKGMTVPLDPFIARDHLSLRQFNPSEMTNCTWQGKVNGLPFDWSINVVYFNKDMFKEANVTLPPEDGNWTWDDLLTTARHFSKSENGHQVQWGFDNLPNYQAVFGVLEANGGKIFSADLKRCLINDPQNIATLEFFRDLVRKWHVAPDPGELPKGVSNSFAGNLVAMSRQGSWVVESMRTQIGTRFNWDIAPMPKGSTGKMAVTGFGSAWSMGISTKHKDEAWTLLSFVSSAQAEAQSLGSGSPPGNVDAYPAYLKTMEQGSQPPQDVATIINVVKQPVFTIPNMPYYDQAAPILYKAIADIYAGKEPSATLGQAQRQINTLIPQYTF